MHYLSLRWLLNALQRLISKNPLVRLSIRAVIQLWSTLSSKSSRWRRRYLHPTSGSLEGKRPPRAEGGVNASLDVDGIPVSVHGLQEPQDAVVPPAYAYGYSTHQSRTPSPNLLPVQPHISNEAQDVKFKRLSSPTQDIAKPEGDIASLKTRISFAHATITPVFPECIGRYDRNVVM
jgi:hypothetical protein